MADRKESRWQQTQDVRKEETDKGYKRGKKGWMIEKELKRSFTFFFFCMNGISQEGNCLVCEVMTSIQGNYEDVWLPKRRTVGEVKSSHQPSSTVAVVRPPECRSQEAELLLLAVLGTAVLCAMQTDERNLMSENTSVQACCYVY